jgi:hypothetical protein
MKSILLPILIVFSSLSFGQEVKVLSQSNTLLKTQHQDFIYLSDSTNIAKAVFVAQIKATGSLKNTSYLYYYIKNKAQEMGANAFRFEQFNKLDSTNGELILSTYYATDELFVANNVYLPQNNLYIFGYDDLTSHKSQGYKINGTRYAIGAGEFAAYSLQDGAAYKINKGGFTGMTYWLKGKAEGDSSFLSFSGIGLNNADDAMYPNGIGVTINTGKINNVDPNLALLLLKLYQEKNNLVR